MAPKGKEIAAYQARRCPRCDTVKRLTEFHRLISDKKGRQRYCKECASKVSIEQYRKQKEEKLNG